MTVLMIEDEVIDQNAFVKFMETNFPEVNVLPGIMNGVDGLEALRIYNPDLVLLDIQMPDMDGLAMLDEARKTGYKGKIIIQTAYDYFDYVKKALNNGANAYLLKPADSTELKETIAKCLDQLKEEQMAEREKMRMQEYITADERGRFSGKEAGNGPVPENSGQTDQERVMEETITKLNAEAGSRQGRNIRKALLFIHQHYCEDISLSQIAGRAGISVYYLSHLFKEKLGCSVNAYLVRLRIQQMKALLAVKDYSTTELAQILGYKDTGYFTRVVKKATGKTVGEIKEEGKEL